MAQKSAFSWPNNAETGLSITFDDARPSQLDAALPILDAFGAKATFFMTPDPAEQRAADWRAAIANGHEPGNHTITHPCSRNFSFIGPNALEEMTLDAIESEMIHCNIRIERCCKVKPVVFAYPCGQTYVGAGEHTRSYVPLAAKHFIAARGFPGERHNLPDRCNLTQVFGCPFDNLSFDAIRAMIETAREEHGWLVLAGHDAGDGRRAQTVDVDALRALCEYAMDPSSRVYTATFGETASLIRNWQEQEKE